MRLNDWLLSIVIIIIFIFLMLFSTVVGGIEDIKKNWHLYKCNPLIMPFAGFFGKDSNDTFSSCVSNSSVGAMQTSLGPITTIFSSLADAAEKQEESTNNSRKYSMNIRSKLSGLGSGIFGIVFSLSTEISKIGLKTKDTINKIVGVVASFVHILSTSISTFNSIWMGPPGATIKFLGGMCFHKDTCIKLNDNNIKKIKDVSIGDVLKDGSIVFGTMKLLNNYNNKYLDDMYIFKESGENNQDIMVSGSHLILLNKETNEYVHVKNHPLSNKMETNENELYCLITNTHKISIGNHVFGDWEDNGDLPQEIKHIPKKIKTHI
jgi:hypothetical protein